MAFFITIGVTIVWCALMYAVATSIFASSARRKTLKVGALTVGLTAAPFAHELYVYFGLQAYCDVYGGIVELEPVNTDALAFNIYRLDASKLLAHPSLRHAKYTGKYEDRQKLSSMSLVTDTNKCNSQIHLRLARSSFKVYRDLADNAEQSGYCYSALRLEGEPRYLLSAGEPDAYVYKQSASVLYPRQVRTTSHMELVDTLSDEVRAKYVSYETKPGLLANIILPEMKTYSCATPRVSGDDDIFPFQDVLYDFLQKAILKAE